MFLLFNYLTAKRQYVQVSASKSQKHCTVFATGSNRSLIVISHLIAYPVLKLESSASFNKFLNLLKCIYYSLQLNTVGLVMKTTGYWCLPPQDIELACSSIFSSDPNSLLWDAQCLYFISTEFLSKWRYVIGENIVLPKVFCSFTQRSVCSTQNWQTYCFCTMTYGHMSSNALHCTE